MSTILSHPFSDTPSHPDPISIAILFPPRSHSRPDPRYMADVRVIPPNFMNGFDFTMFPRGDWEAMLNGDYDGTGEGNPVLAGTLPIKIEALPEGTTVQPGERVATGRCCWLPAGLTLQHPWPHFAASRGRRVLLQVDELAPSLLLAPEFPGDSPCAGTHHPIPPTLHQITPNHTTPPTPHHPHHTKTKTKTNTTLLHTTPTHTTPSILTAAHSPL